MKLSLLPALLASSLLAGATPAQTCDGNGLGQAFLAHTPARIGGTIAVSVGSPALPGGIAFLCVAAGPGPVPHPLLGQVCLGIDLPFFFIYGFALNGAGSYSFQLPLASAPALVASPPLFAAVLTIEGPVLSVSKTVRIAWENTDGYSPVGALGTLRASHTATSLAGGPADNRTKVLVAGGGGGTFTAPQATATSELYDPVQRAFVPGPTMAAPRTLHAAVRLNDGRVLVSGGSDSNGVITSTAELYDPATNAFVATGSMTTPRAGHDLTLLPDGRVFAAGGVADFQNATAMLAAALSTAQDTAEIYDPATGTWSAVPGTMVSKRTGHTQTLLVDGRVLIAAGIDGGTNVFGFQLPRYTNTCDVYDPVANALAPAPSLATTRGFHAASRLGDGRVLVTGGNLIQASLVATTSSCEVFDGVSWSTVGALPVGVANHTQITSPTRGLALIQGGLAGTFPSFLPTAQAGDHDGTSFTASNDVGLNPGFPAATAFPIGLHAATRLYDGTILLVGGSDGFAPISDAFVYLE